jgi:hypothetical protein
VIDAFINEGRLRPTECSYCDNELQEAADRYSCATCLTVVCAGSACYGRKFREVGRL